MSHPLPFLAFGAVAGMVVANAPDTSNPADWGIWGSLAIVLVAVIGLIQQRRQSKVKNAADANLATVVAQLAKDFTALKDEDVAELKEQGHATHHKVNGALTELKALTAVVAAGDRRVSDALERIVTLERNARQP